jgi:drug/metabolite transporter (DMT)-like permease
LGIALVVAAAIAWSTAPFFTRLLPYDSWTILFWRGLFGGGLIVVLMVLLQGRAGLRDLTRIDKNGWLVASFSTLAMIAFIPSLQLTDVSNVAIIIATGPFLAAALAWIWLREIPQPRTMLASIVALCGVTIIVGNARAGSDILGIALACFMALAIAAMTVMVRRHKNTSMVAAAAMSNILGSVISIPFAHEIAGDNRVRLAHSRDVWILSGRPGPHAVLPRLAAAAVGPGGPDLDAGDAADAVLDMGRIWRDSRAAGILGRRPGNGRRYCRHRRRYPRAAAIKMNGPSYRTANGAW